MASDNWYPRIVEDLIPWHANFAGQATANGVSLGLSAAQVTQIGHDADAVAQFINNAITIEIYRKAYVAYRDQWLHGATDAVPPEPPVPGLSPIAVGWKGGIEKRTRQLVGVIKSSPIYTEAIGAAYQIIPGGPIPLATPGLSATAQTGSKVKLSISKKGYLVLAVDSKRGTGDWEQLGISQTATYLDERPPMVAGQPEVREYRVQGMVNNQRVGDYSEHASAVTIP